MGRFVEWILGMKNERSRCVKQAILQRGRDEV